MARTARLCTDCDTRRVSSNPDVRAMDLCNPCYDYAGWENTHSDEGHAKNGADDTCPICHPELDTRNPAARKGHTNTVAKTRTSHAACNHPATPRDRAACRKARATA